MQLMAAVALTAHSKDTPTKDIKLRRHGLPITIEHPRGTIRVLHDDSGNVVYKQHMHAHYGYFSGTKGRDGDDVDVFVGPVEAAKEVYIIHMLDKGPVKAEREDEDKCFVGYQSPEAAKTAFLTHYPKSFYGGMTCLPVNVFKKKLKTAKLPHREKKLHASYNDLVKKSFEVEATPDVLARFEKFLAYVKRCSDIGHSTTVGMEIDAPSRKTYVEIAAGKAKCPHCGSKKFTLMPTDFETAKCSKCKKNFNYGA